MKHNFKVTELILSPNYLLKCSKCYNSIDVHIMYINGFMINFINQTNRNSHKELSIINMRCKNEDLMKALLL